MKTIIYALLAIMLFGSIASGYLKGPDSRKSIRIESVESNITLNQLSQSAEIIATRLKYFSKAPYEIELNPAKNQILVTLGKGWDLKAAYQLIMHKGEVAFYSQFDSVKLAEIMNDNDALFTLRHSRN